MKTLSLLPQKFKIIGIVLIVFTTAIMIVIRFFFKELIEISDNKYIFDSLSNCINLGLFFIFFSKRKDDDEMMVELRLKSIMIAFIFGLAFSITTPIMNTVLSSNEELSVFRLLLTMQLVQIAHFYSQKRKLTKELSSDEE